ncbi:mechanosensitive ion channel family protein [Desulfovibrio ferrophilus]|uniref:Transporter, small conductance mechanosensitive ion channel MscS family protein n=1 Tax=Desulfovibrio ferrophilus TaxID=241368 RepID=A0A2Z6AZI7_9BACT|nr:mechanosensitive ion channel domain-containing protein [Desulfovibrio ferrophilus]BBD08603.1 transporter, small conductance mechanosensitive ion channel MscS family protein [Desulfovibrio ferrophilus]
MQQQPFSLEAFIAWGLELPLQAWKWLTVGSGAMQAAVVLGVVLLGWLLALPLKQAVRARFPGGMEGDLPLPRLARTLVRALPAMVSALLAAAAREGLKLSGYGGVLLDSVLTLLVVSSVIILGSSIIRSRFWRRCFATLAVIAATLHVLGILGPVMQVLDSVGFDLGGTRVTLLVLAKAALLLLIFFRLGGMASIFVERRLEGVSELTPSTRVLLSKTARISFYVLATLLALNSVGIDLTALTVFSGAIGVGVGFGLRNVFANLISGLILLMDKSIKPGDVIEIGGVYGWITELRGRFVSVVTRDGKEYLIPNEDLITSQVVNWSFSDSNVRLKVPVGVSYGTDIKRALKLMEQAVQGLPRVLLSPAPVALFLEFGDSSLNLELRVWIKDPQNGVANITSAINVAILDVFRAEGIQIPFPQRDVHIISE